MPIKEAVFWVALTVFGTGIYFWTEGDAKRMGWAVAMTFLGVAGVVYSVWAHHKPNAPKIPVWLLLLAVTWVGIGYDIYSQQHSKDDNPALLEFDAQHNQSLVLSYGGSSPSSCAMTINGSALESRMLGYKLALGCFVSDGSTDILDVPYLQIGNLYDIKMGPETIQANYAPYFLDYMTKSHAIGISVALLIVPNGVQPSQFSSLRQARALGVLIPEIATARSSITFGPSPNSN